MASSTSSATGARSTELTQAYEAILKTKQEQIEQMGERLASQRTHALHVASSHQQERKGLVQELASSRRRAHEMALQHAELEAQNRQLTAQSIKQVEALREAKALITELAAARTQPPPPPPPPPVRPRDDPPASDRTSRQPAAPSCAQVLGRLPRTFEDELPPPSNVFSRTHGIFGRRLGGGRRHPDRAPLPTATPVPAGAQRASALGPPMRNTVQRHDSPPDPAASPPRISAPVSGTPSPPRLLPEEEEACVEEDPALASDDDSIPGLPSDDGDLFDTSSSVDDEEPRVFATYYLAPRRPTASVSSPPPPPLSSSPPSCSTTMPAPHSRSPHGLWTSPQPPPGTPSSSPSPRRHTATAPKPSLQAATREAETAACNAAAAAPPSERVRTAFGAAFDATLSALECDVRKLSDRLEAAHHQHGASHKHTRDVGWAPAANGARIHVPGATQEGTSPRSRTKEEPRAHRSPLSARTTAAVGARSSHARPAWAPPSTYKESVLTKRGVFGPGGSSDENRPTQRLHVVPIVQLF